MNKLSESDLLIQKANIDSQSQNQKLTSLQYQLYELSLLYEDLSEEFIWIPMMFSNFMSSIEDAIKIRE